MLLRTSKQLPFDEGRFAIDYRLVDDGIVVTDDYFSVVMDGTVHLANESEPANKTFSRLPLHDPDGAEVQIMVSEYSLNSVLRTAA